jgi:hypothetical protein
MSLNYTDTAAYPYFLAVNSAQQNTTASGKLVVFGTLREGNNFAGSTFTAPVKGLYMFTATLTSGSNGGVAAQSAQTSATMRWGFEVTQSPSQANYYYVGDNMNYFSDTVNFYAKHCSAVIPLNALDTVSVFTSGIGSPTVLVFLAGRSWFSGHLITAIA